MRPLVLLFLHPWERLSWFHLTPSSSSSCEPFLMIKFVWRSFEWWRMVVNLDRSLCYFVDDPSSFLLHIFTIRSLQAIFFFLGDILAFYSYKSTILWASWIIILAIILLIFGSPSIQSFDNSLLYIVQNWDMSHFPHNSS